ncbi:hypothetical protein COLO4_26861 [Corchorus olitorius]|uniref:Uncharacterized protein n=1 Tax=Corchorus olitorius TaxID=93759 RepID=A0A1R3HTZ7_9ROSI|nr:hypothetical protein COLO4_26861 [Corchorus olitorius]
MTRPLPPIGQGGSESGAHSVRFSGRGAEVRPKRAGKQLLQQNASADLRGIAGTENRGRGNAIRIRGNTLEEGGADNIPGIRPNLSRPTTEDLLYGDIPGLGPVGLGREGWGKGVLAHAGNSKDKLGSLESTHLISWVLKRILRKGGKEALVRGFWVQMGQGILREGPEMMKKT